MEFNLYNVSHDEWDHSTHELKKYLWNKSSPRWRQPLSFGPSPGPRHPLNQPSDTLSYARQHQVVYSIRFTTSRTYLQNLFPSEQFSFTGPATLVQASIVCCSLRNMVWLGDTGYNHCGLYIHGVQYTKKDGAKVHGTFLPILFENLADPIITGREELGASKLFCDIDIQETGASHKVTMGWRGTVFAELDFDGLVDGPPASANAATQVNSADTDCRNEDQKPIVPKPMPDDGMLMYRYIPAVGEPGKADAEYAVFDAYTGQAEAKDRGPDLASEQETDGHVGKERAKFSTSGSTTKVAEKSDIRFHAGDWKSFPTIHHVVEGLAGVPIYTILEAKMEFVPQVSDVRGAKRVE